MAQAAATETMIENELSRIDNNSIRDLALIGLDKVKHGGIARSSAVDDKTIDALKRMHGSRQVVSCKSIRPPSHR
jgi:hypothetical protein